MVTLKTKFGNEIQCEAVMRGRQFDVVHIYTHTISPIQAYEILGDPNEAEELTVIEEIGDHVATRKYRGYTDIFCVRKSPLFTDVSNNEILIWLQKPQNDEYSEEQAGEQNGH